MIHRPTLYKLSKCKDTEMYDNGKFIFKFCNGIMVP